MATSFIPNMTTLGMSACCPEQYISRKQTPMTPPYLVNYSPSNFGDPSRLLRKALVYRHFYNFVLDSNTMGELVDPSIFKSVQKPDFWDGHFWGILSEQYISPTVGTPHWRFTDSWDAKLGFHRQLGQTLRCQGQAPRGIFLKPLPKVRERRQRHIPHA